MTQISLKAGVRDPVNFLSFVIMPQLLISGLVDYSSYNTKFPTISQVNPPKMEKIEDVTSMTYLNDASVLWNLKTRYVAKLIYVRFCWTGFNPEMHLFWKKNVL